MPISMPWDAGAVGRTRAQEGGKDPWCTCTAAQGGASLFSISLYQDFTQTKTVSLILKLSKRAQIWLKPRSKCAFLSHFLREICLKVALLCHRGTVKKEGTITLIMRAITWFFLFRKCQYLYTKKSNVPNLASNHVIITAPTWRHNEADL